MNNFTSIFEELSKLYEEDDAAEALPVDEPIDESCREELVEAVEDEVAEDEPIGDQITAEEDQMEVPVVEEEPRRVICECDKCGALVIIDEADIAVAEDSDLVNVDTECQFCEEANGYKIIGVVAPYEVAEEEEIVEALHEENNVTTNKHTVVNEKDKQITASHSLSTPADDGLQSKGLPTNDREDADDNKDKVQNVK